MGARPQNRDKTDSSAVTQILHAVVVVPLALLLTVTQPARAPNQLRPDRQQQETDPSAVG